MASGRKAKVSNKAPTAGRPPIIKIIASLLKRSRNSTHGGAIAWLIGAMLEKRPNR